MVSLADLKALDTAVAGSFTLLIRNTRLFPALSRDTANVRRMLGIFGNFSWYSDLDDPCGSVLVRFEQPQGAINCKMFLERQPPLLCSWVLDDLCEGEAEDLLRRGHDASSVSTGQ